jgi:uncharacterized protein
MGELISTIAKELSLQEAHIRSAIKLLIEEENTIPFVARYRKEMTGSMDEVALRQVRDRYEYLKDLETTKAKYIENIEELAKTQPELAARLPDLRARFAACKTKQEVEDLYLPFKPKRRTRAQAAREKGLEPLLEAILAQRATLTLEGMEELAKAYIKTDADEKLSVLDAESALSGARDIWAERVSEMADIRGVVRQLSLDTGRLVAEKAPETKELLSNPKKKAQIPKYQNYFQYSEPLKEAAPHRIMAVRRGETEKILRLHLEVDEAQIGRSLSGQLLEKTPTNKPVKEWLFDGLEDAYKRLLGPSIETEIRLELKKPFGCFPQTSKTCCFFPLSQTRLSWGSTRGSAQGPSSL